LRLKQFKSVAIVVSLVALATLGLLIQKSSFFVYQRVDYISPTPSTVELVSISPSESPALTPSSIFGEFTENFNATYTAEEAGSLESSGGFSWWISSGAYLYSADGLGSTAIGALPSEDHWRLKYSRSNVLDTEDGYYPQNIFRLVSKNKWENGTQEAYFKIIADNLTDSPNRNSSNGLLFFNRYNDAFNLYYTGIRVDGYVTIKKKIGGIYHTLAHERVILGTYNRDTNPNLLPKDIWIGLRSVVSTQTDGSVSIKFYIDIGRTGVFKLAAQAVDDGESYGGLPFVGPSYGGIRTDFMDVQFDDYQLRFSK